MHCFSNKNLALQGSGRALCEARPSQKARPALFSMGARPPSPFRQWVMVWVSSTAISIMSVLSSQVNWKLLEVRSLPPLVALQGLQNAFDAFRWVQSVHQSSTSSHAGDDEFTEAKRIRETQGQFCLCHLPAEWPWTNV